MEFHNRDVTLNIAIKIDEFMVYLYDINLYHITFQ